MLSYTRGPTPGIQTWPPFSFLSRQNGILDDAFRTMCRNSSVCGVNGIPQGRLGLVSLVRCSWTNTPPAGQAACVRAAPAFSHLYLQLQLSISYTLVPAPLSFPPTAVNFSQHGAARLPRGQRRELGAGCSPVRRLNCCLEAGVYSVCHEKCSQLSELEALDYTESHGLFPG